MQIIIQFVIKTIVCNWLKEQQLSDTGRTFPCTRANSQAMRQNCTQRLRTDHIMKRPIAWEKRTSYRCPVTSLLRCYPKKCRNLPYQPQYIRSRLLVMDFCLRKAAFLRRVRERVLEMVQRKKQEISGLRIFQNRSPSNPECLSET